MNILLALTYYRPHYSGLTIHAEREARALAARGHHVTVLTSRYEKHLLAREVCDGVEIIRPNVLFHISKGVIMPSLPYWAWKLVRQSDVVHLHIPQLDAALVAVMCRLLRKPLVTSYHCDLLLPPGFVNRLANLASDFANRVTVSAAGAMVHNTRDGAEHSRFMRRYLHKLYPILPPAEIAPVTDADRVAFREKYNLLPGQRIIGMAARLAAEKGVEILAAALPRVLEKYPTARVLFVGQHAGLRAEEPYAERVMRLVEHLNDHWQFLGVISPVEMSAFFHECEVTVLPSTNSTESYGLVQIESMMCGTPVVASDLPGVRVPVQMTGMGHIVPPGDAQALAEALIAVLDNPAAYQKDASAVVQKSTPEAVAEEYEKVFETVRRRVQHGA